MCLTNWLCNFGEDDLVKIIVNNKNILGHFALSDDRWGTDISLWKLWYNIPFVCNILLTGQSILTSEDLSDN